MNDTDLDRLRAMRDGLDRSIDAPDPQLFSDLRRSFTAEQLDDQPFDEQLLDAPPAVSARASRRQLLLAGLGGAAACGLVIGGVRFYQGRQPVAPAGPVVPAAPPASAGPVPVGTPAPNPAPAGYPLGAALPMTRNPLPDPLAPPGPSAAPRTQRPVSGLQPPGVGEQEVRRPLLVTFAEYGDEKESAPDPRAIRRWQDGGELRLDTGGGNDSLLRRTEATSYRFFDHGSEQAYHGSPYAGHQEVGDRTVLLPPAGGMSTDPVKLLTDTVHGLPADKQRLGVVGYWTIRTVAEKLVLEGPRLSAEQRTAYLKALQRVEGVEVTGAYSDPAGGPVDAIRMAWINATGTASVEVRFLAANGLVIQYLDQRYLDNRVCMPRETGQCTLQYNVSLSYRPG